MIDEYIISPDTQREQRLRRRHYRFEQIEPHLVEGRPFRIQHETDALAASRLRSVVKPEYHLVLPSPAITSRMEDM